MAHNELKSMVAHGSSRSGYAQDIMPGNTTMAVPGSVLPPASQAGRQAGRIAPAKKRYGQAKYESVTAGEAMARLNKRSTGQLPPIHGGLDDPNAGRAAQTAEGAAQAVQNQVARMMTQVTQDIPDSEWGGVESSPGDMDGFDPVPEHDTSGKPEPVLHRPLQHSPEIGQYAKPVLGKQAQFMAQRRRITMELTDSTVTMSVIDMIHSRYGITILLPQSPDGMTFIPKPGSEITLREGDKAYVVYFPGTYFDLPALGLVGLSFVKADEPAA